MTTVYDDAFYDAQSDGSLMAARSLVPVVQSLVQASSVLDVGAGVGTWVAEWSRAGVDAFGCDGDYVDRNKLKCDPIRFASADLSEPNNIVEIFPGRDFDLVTCLEVAEHLEENIADRFVAALCARSPMVLFGAAVPGQGGMHHVNERFPSYWVEKFESQAFRPFDIFRPIIHRIAAPFWYRQNMILFLHRSVFDDVFQRAIANGFVERALTSPMDVAHFTLYLEKLNKLQSSGGGMTK